MLKAQPTTHGYQLLEIRMRREKDGRDYVALDSPYGEKQEGILRLSLNPDDVAWALTTATQLTQSATRRGGASDLQDPLRQLGITLFGALFEGRRESLYRRTLASAREMGVRVVLRIRSRHPELDNVPWEFLHDGQDFVNLSTWSSMVRSPWVAAAAPAPLSLDSLRVLIMVADITGKMDAEKEVEQLTALSTQYPQLHLTIVRDVTRQTLLEVLNREPHHVLHFIGTGVNTGSGDQALALLSGQEEGSQTKSVSQTEETVSYDLLPVRALWMALQEEQPDLRLAVFSACKTDIFAGSLAETVPAVVGMRGDLSARACIVFAEGLYRGLVAGRSLEESVALGRQEIDLRLTGSREWGLPVAYLQQMEGVQWASVSKLVDSEVSFGFEALETMPPVDAEHAAVWRKYEVLSQIYQMNLETLEEQKIAYGETPPTYVATQIAETQTRLEQVRAQLNELTADAAK